MTSGGNIGGVRRRVAMLAAVLAGILGAGAALARPATPNVPPTATAGELAAIEAEREALFGRMLADPADLDTAFAYAALSAQAGDLEGAIATLERMLIFAPGLPRLQLELGVLYFRLGADETAESYLRGALAAPGVPREVRDRVEPYLAEIAKRSDPATLGGAILLGGRYQTNSNAAPETRNLRLNGIDFLLSEQATRRADVNGFASANLLFSYDLANQGDRLEASLSTYGAFYGERRELDTALAELTLGPALNLQRFRIDGATLGVYAILGGVLLDGDPFLASGGVGTSFVKAFGTRTRATARFEYRRESFRDSTLRPTSSDRTGNRVRASVSAERQLSSRLTASVALDGERRDAEVDDLSLWEGGASLGATLLVASPFPRQGEPWSLSLGGGVVARRFDEPDLVFSRTEAQDDLEAFAQTTLAIPLRRNWSVQTTALYRDVSSNYALRDYDNVGLTLGLMKRF